MQLVRNTNMMGKHQEARYKWNSSESSNKTLFFPPFPNFKGSLQSLLNPKDFCICCYNLRKMHSPASGKYTPRWALREFIISLLHYYPVIPFWGSSDLNSEFHRLNECWAARRGISCRGNVYMGRWRLLTQTFSVFYCKKFQMYRTFVKMLQWSPILLSVVE